MPVNQRRDDVVPRSSDAPLMNPPPIDLTIEPRCADLIELVAHPPAGKLFGQDMTAWRARTRRELALADDRPIIATGHQTLLWHPGILAKYLLVDALAASGSPLPLGEGLGVRAEPAGARHGGHSALATANLVVDQHAGGFAELPVPIRRADGSLAERTLQLTSARPDVPMALHPPFTPPGPPANLNAASPSVQSGLASIYDAIVAHREAPNAAIQMARALADLMRPWVGPTPNVTASDLLETSLSRAILAKMVDDPWACAEHYNRAVASLPEAGIAGLLVRDDMVELPLWRIREDGRRMHAYDGDVQRWLESNGAAQPVRLMPRALFMTALVRLGMCDLFVHGTGGGNYDRAMEIWIRDWLGVEVSPKAVATATLLLPLIDEPAGKQSSVDDAMRALRRAQHDPEPVAAAAGVSPGPLKRAMLARIDALPRASAARRMAFLDMHAQLAAMREKFDRVQHARQSVETARRRVGDARIANRRTWAFPLYPSRMIDELAERVRAAVGERCDESPHVSGG